MSADIIRIGLLFSVSGSYRTIGRSMLNGALLAVEEINADPDFLFQLDVVTADPGGCNMRYAEAAGRMLSDEQLVHIVGCYMSSSRIEVLPFFEKHDGLLWYPSHYEGFESSEHVVYTGAAPNQHIVPLAEWLLTHCGDSAFFIGSNYIWAWENNKIMREAVLASGGEVLAERYLPVGETVRCPWHGWEFDLRTGKSYCDPARTWVKSYATSIEPGASVAEGPLSPDIRGQSRG